MTVAELIEQLKLLPPDAPVIQTEAGRWAEPDVMLFAPGEKYDGIEFDQTTVVV